MINIRNLDSKENVGIRSIGIFRKIWSIGIFAILLSQDGFESDCPEAKFQAITS